MAELKFVQSASVAESRGKLKVYITDFDNRTSIDISNLNVNLEIDENFKINGHLTLSGVIKDQSSSKILAKFELDDVLENMSSFMSARYTANMLKLTNILMNEKDFELLHQYFEFNIQWY